jgi:hypothetical protein
MPNEPAAQKTTDLRLPTALREVPSYASGNTGNARPIPETAPAGLENSP